MKQYIAILFMFTFSSCISQRYLISHSTIKFERTNTNIRNFMDIDGYHRNYDYGGSNAMFFEDGTYVKYFSFKEGATEANISINMVKWMKWINDWGLYWGVYRIESDTLICHYYDKGSIFRIISFNEERYKIINRTTLIRIYWRDRSKEGDKEYSKKRHDPWLKGVFLYHFKPANNLPSSDCWLKEKKWIWRYEQDWRNYMEKKKRKR